MTLSNIYFSKEKFKTGETAKPYLMMQKILIITQKLANIWWWWETPACSLDVLYYSVHMRQRCT